MSRLAEQPAQAHEPTDAALIDAGTAKTETTDPDAATETEESKDDTTGEEEQPSTHPRRLAIALLVAIASAAIAVDQITKHLVVSRLTDHPPVRLLGGAIYLVLTRNSGAAFSMGTSVTWVFPTIAIAVAAAILMLAIRLRSLPWAASFGLVLGGAIGNLIDRLFRAPGMFRGSVVDFISLLSDRGAGFAIFNLADSALVCGVVLAVLLELTGRHRDGSRVRH